MVRVGLCSGATHIGLLLFLLHLDWLLTFLKQGQRCCLHHFQLTARFIQVWCLFSTCQAHGWQGFAECHVETSEEIGIKGVAEWPTFQISPQETFNLFQPSVLHHLEALRDWNAWPFLVIFIQGLKKYVEAILFHDVKNSFCFLSKLPKSPKMYRLFAELYSPEKLNCIFPLNKSVEFNACLSTH